ncbi:MAG: P-loop NTPase fold protein [Nitrospira sp.]|nr:KAP family NTPase [Nitrospira sp.]
MKFNPDRPICKLGDDLLGRKSFVNAIAASIVGWKGSESLIIGLSGPWGSGKSSVKNMMKEVLSSAEKNIQVVEFNPWQWAGQDQLGEAFFREIEIALGKSPSADNKKSAAKWRLYSARLRIGVVVTGVASHFVTALLSLISGAGLISLITEHFAWALGAVIVGGLVLVARKALAKLAELAVLWMELKEANAAVYQLSTDEIKSQLREDLERLTRPILVIIDDIDRLTAPQICFLFQLVKTNGDFPNLVYLLLMERDIVEESLNSVTSGNGKNYLEKIVQVSLHLPVIARGTLLDVLEKETRGLLAAIDALNEEEESRFSMALSYISPHFKTLRGVHRFMNVLAFELSILRGDSALSVDKIDLVGLTVLKVFYEKIYYRISKAKHILTREQDDKEEVGRIRDSMLTQCAEDDRETVLNLLAFLFPNFPWDETIRALPPYREEDALSKLHISHPKNFDRYFVGSIEPGDISSADFRDFLKNCGDRKKTYESLKDFNEKNVLVSVFERLLASTSKLEGTHLEPLLIALFDVADECLPEWQSGNRSAIDRGLIFLSSSILQKPPDKESSLNLLSKALEQTTGLYLPVVRVALETPESKRQAVGALTEQELSALKTVCVDKIKAWAFSGRLIQHPAFGYLVLRWEEWAPSQCSDWMATQIGAKEVALKLCSTLQDRSISSSGVHYSVRLDHIAKVADIHAVAKTLSALKTDELTAEEQQTSKLFFLALNQSKS